MSLVTQKFKGTPRKGGKEYTINCFMCPRRGKGEDTKQHLYINTEKGVCHCFRCGWAGNIKQLFFEYDGSKYTGQFTEKRKFSETKKLLVQLRNLESETRELIIPGYRELVSSSPYNSSYRDKLTEYLFSRGLTLPEIEERGIGYSLHGEKFHNRVILPVFDLQGRIIYYQARAIDDRKDKYVNPRENKDKVVYNLLSARNYIEPVLVEGIFDCVLPNYISGLGKTLGEYQLQLIAGLWKKIVIMFDPDAQREAAELGKALNSRGVKVRLADCPGKDPDSCEIFEVETAARVAIPYSVKSYFFTRISSGRTAGSH